MSSGKGSHSKDLERRQLDLDSQPSNTPSWRSKQLEATGRTGDDSATPPPSSASPAYREFRARAQRGELSDSWKHATPNQGKPKNQGSASDGTQSSASTDGGVRLNTEQFPIPRRLGSVQNDALSANPSGLVPSDTQGQSSTALLAQNTTASRTSEVLSNNMALQMIISKLPAHFQAILVDIGKKIARSPAIPQATKDMLNLQLAKLFRDMSDSQSRLQQNLDHSNGERDKLQEQLGESRQLLDTVIQDRMRISAERDTLQLRLSKIDLGCKEDIDSLRKSEKHLREVNETLLEQIRIQDEQLKGRRALWMDANPSSVSRRRAMSSMHDPFNSPLQPQNSEIGGGANAGINSPSPIPGNISLTGKSKVFESPNQRLLSWGTSVPPPLMRFPTAPSSFPSMSNRTGHTPSPNLSIGKGSRRRHNFVGNDSTSGNQVVDPFETPASLRRYSTEPTSDSFAMVPFATEEDRYLEFKTGIGHVYHLAQDWAKAYADHPDFEKDQVIAKSNKQLWDYMMNCTYPGHRREAHTHVVSLLSDPVTRILLLTRMAVTYCIQDIMSIDAFKEFSPAISVAIEDVKVKLQERGLANDARQTLIDRQVEAVQSMVNSPTYDAFRTTQLNLHTTRLRDMLGPLLNRGCARSEAGKELGIIAVTSWEISIKMFTSHLSFQVYFPETTARFSAATMVATDARADPSKLQFQQARLKLVVTPVITVRDDRGTTIKAKNLHMASVFIVT